MIVGTFQFESVAGVDLQRISYGFGQDDASGFVDF